MDQQYYKFYSDTGQHYPEEEIVYNTLRGKLRRKFINTYLNNCSGSLLDIGCNRGMYLEYYSGGQTIGIDLSIHALKFAQNRRMDKSISCILGDAEDLNFLKPDTFDNILCSEMLEHVYQPDKVIAGIKKLLKPGGKVLITTPNYVKKKPAWANIGLLEQYGITGLKEDQYFHTAFKPYELSQMMEKENMLVLENGTLEKEIRYAVKIPVLLFFSVDFLNNTIFRSKKINYLNRKFLDVFSQWIYKLASLLRLDKVLQSIFREGARSYIIAVKPE